jgi:16S rRNA (cytosine1402-N4)-methyltransferase
MENNASHESVMLQEAVAGLAVQPNGIYIDATYGRGGHSQAILKLLGDNGQLISIDKDPEAVADANKRFANESRIKVFHRSFAQVAEVAKSAQVAGSVNGVLFDLGVSSPHFDEARRGFSFSREGPLDMRMDTTRGMTAAEWLAQVSESELITVLRNYGEERYARRIAAAVIAARQQQAIDTTTRLAAIISAAVPSRERHKHPATRSFQAIRIYINQELEELKTSLEQVLDVLAVGGRLVAISFHSLEDRIVKQFIQRHTGQYDLPRHLPIQHDQICQRLQKVGRYSPSETEVNNNPRARSAVCRVAEKLQ